MVTDHETTYWNGLPTLAIRGTAVVADAPEFPQYWAKNLIGMRIPVIRVVLEGVNFGGGVTYLDNREGVGWLKVTEGKGMPQYSHADVAIVTGSFEGKL